jgi:hypothetical protein
VLYQPVFEKTLYNDFSLFLILILRGIFSCWENDWALRKVLMGSVDFAQAGVP